MCGKAERIPFHRSRAAVLIILLCAAGLSLHFIAEGLSPGSGAAGLVLIDRGGHSHPAHEHADDQFVLSATTDPIERGAGSFASLPKPGRAFSFILSPNCPPPNS